MSDPDVTQPDEGQAAEVENLPAPSDPEHPDHAPEDPDADTDGPSDDDATGADAADDTDGADESGAPVQPEPAPPDTESRLDAVTTALAKAARTYANRVAAIFDGDWMGASVCPLCADDFPGIVTPAPRSEATVAAVRPIIGLPDLSTYRDDKYARTCDRCDGLGKTLTGSRVPAYATMNCPECLGAGFKSAETPTVTVARVNGDVVPPPPTHTDEPPVPAMPQASIDALERMLESARNAGVAGQ